MAKALRSAAMETFLSSDPELAKVGEVRDKYAWIALGDYNYEIYDQDSLKVITLRAKSAAPSEPARSSK